MISDNPIIYIADIVFAVPVVWFLLWLTAGLLRNGVRLVIPNHWCAYGLAAAAWVVLRVAGVVA